MQETLKKDEEQEIILGEAEKELLAELFKAGVHVGHHKSKSHPKMDDYVFATRHNIKLLDLSKTIEKLKIAAQFLGSILKSGGTVLVVGTKPPTRDIVASFASTIGQPFITERWLGGTLTNYKTIHKRIEYMEELLKKRETGELEKYTKKEKLDFDKELADLEKRFNGWRQLSGMPQAIFIVDLKKHETVLNEANRMHIPVAAIVDTDSDPTSVPYPIPASDDSRSAVKAILEVFSRLVLQAKNNQSETVK